jgi:hypothetical protein
MYKDKEVQYVKNFFVNVWRKNIFDIYVTESLYENASLIIFSEETEYISTRYWYRNINFLRDRIRRIFLYLKTVTVTAGTFEP